MNRIAIPNLSKVRAMARGDLAGTAGGFQVFPPSTVDALLYKLCLLTAKTPLQRLFCRIKYGPRLVIKPPVLK